MNQYLESRMIINVTNVRYFSIKNVQRAILDHYFSEKWKET